MLKDNKLYLKKVNAENNKAKIKSFFIGAGVGAGILAVIGLIVNFVPRK